MRGFGTFLNFLRLEVTECLEVTEWLEVADIFGLETGEDFRVTDILCLSR